MMPTPNLYVEEIVRGPNAPIPFKEVDGKIIEEPEFVKQRTDAGGGVDHSYFRKVPSVSSDLILMLRDDIDAGDPGRPLKNIGLKFWQIPPGYPDNSQ